MKREGQIRREIKRVCRARAAGQLGRCIGMQVLYMLPLILLTAILYIAIFGRTVALASTGYVDEYALASVLLDDLTGSAVWAILLVMVLVSGPLNYGQMRFYIRMERGEEPPVSTLFGPFTAIDPLWAGVRMGFCLFARAALWSLLPAAVLMAGILGTAAAVLASPSTAAYEGAYSGIVITCVLCMLGMLFIQVRLLAYRAGWIILHEREDCGAWAAARDAAQVFKGHYGRLLAFVCSFLGWEVLLYAGSSLCIRLGVYGMNTIGGDMGVAVFVMSSIAALCLTILLGAFLAAYFNTSFISLYMYYSSQSGEDDALPYGFMPQGGGRADGEGNPPPE